MKRNYLLSIIVIGLIVLSLYSTYAMFTASVSTNDIVNLNSGIISTNTETIEYERLTIKSKEKKVIEFIVSNSTNNSLYYGVWYEMIKPIGINDNIIICKKEDTQNDTLGQLTNGSNAKVSFVIENKTSSSIIVNIGVGYSSTNELNLPTNRYLITDVYKEGALATDYVIDLYSSVTKSNFTNNNIQYERAESVSLMTDVGGNIRYYGADPNNYVLFNNELWRIIGVFKNIDNGTGKKEKRLKIVRSESIGNYPWNENGTNNWPEATLNIYLNGEYFNNLIREYKDMIEPTLWNLGGWSTSEIYADNFYQYERGDLTYKDNAKFWIEKVGLIYPSDYMYAGDLSKCSLNGYNWNDDQNNCRNTSWIIDKVKTQWTLFPSSNDIKSYLVRSSGSIDWFGNGVTPPGSTHPVLFLKSTVKITNGDGSKTNPYTLKN